MKPTPKRRRAGSAGALRAASRTAADIPAGFWIRPEARDRWMLPLVETYTPSYISLILRGAVQGDLERQWEMFDLMEQTWPRLVKNLGELKDAVIDLDWTVEAWSDRGQRPTPSADDRARLVERAIWNMSPQAAWDENDLEDTVRDVLDARAKGISVLEVDWAMGEGAVVPRATRWIHPRHYGYAGAEGDRLMLRSTAADQSGAFMDFPERKFLVAIAKSKSGHPLTSAMLRCLGIWWCASNFTPQWFLNYAQIFGQPIRWATYDPGLPPSDRLVLDQMLEQMGSAAWARFPAGTVLELKEAAKGATENPQKVMLDMADRVCDLLILRQTLTSDVSGTGSRALGEVHERVLEGVKKACAGWVAKILNRQLIAPMMALNYGNTDECPRLVPSVPAVQDPKADAERDKILLDAGADLPRAWFYERHKVPMPAAGDDVITKPGPAVGGPAVGGPAVNPFQPGGTDQTDQTPQTNEDANVQAKASREQEQLIDNVLEGLTGVQAKWLAGVKPFFRELLAKAQSDQVSDADLVRAIEAARRQIPELFHRLNGGAVRDALEAAMGAACFNGAMRGYLERYPKVVENLRRKGRPAPEGTEEGPAQEGLGQT